MCAITAVHGARTSLTITGFSMLALATYVTSNACTAKALIRHDEGDE